MDTLEMSVNKNLADVATLLQWAHRARAMPEKIEHVSRAIALLEDIREQLRTLKG